MSAFCTVLLCKVAFFVHLVNHFHNHKTDYRFVFKRRDRGRRRCYPEQGFTLPGTTCVCGDRYEYWTSLHYAGLHCTALHFTGLTFHSLSFFSQSHCDTRSNWCASLWNRNERSRTRPGHIHTSTSQGEELSYLHRGGTRCSRHFQRYYSSHLRCHWNSWWNRVCH